jgi:hypothetical protein
MSMGSGRDWKLKNLMQMFRMIKKAAQALPNSSSSKFPIPDEISLEQDHVMRVTCH